MAGRLGGAKIAIALVVLAVVGVAVLLRTGPAAPPGSGGAGDPDALWGRTFLSVAVTEDGQPKPLLDGARLRLSFHRREDAEGEVRWRAGCNHMSAPVTVAGGRLDVGGTFTTDMACGGGHHEQDVWTSRFFAADPSWALADGRLRLEAGGTVIDLVPAS